MIQTSQEVAAVSWAIAVIIKGQNWNLCTAAIVVLEEYTEV